MIMQVVNLGVIEPIKICKKYGHDYAGGEPRHH